MTESFSSAASSPSSTVPTLQDLCAKQALKQILSSDFTYVDFTSLEPRLQAVLFEKLRTETSRLKKIAEEFSQLKLYLPSTDIQIQDGTYIPEDDIAYTQVEMFQQKWSYAKAAEMSSIAMAEDQVKWGTLNLYPKSPESGFEVHRRYPPPYHMWDTFKYRISSQLLLYRLTILFGMPPPVEGDGYKSCWETKIGYSDDNSILCFCDFKGAPRLNFRGSAEASTNALELVNFLAALNFPHTYDGTRAGARPEGW